MASSFVGEVFSVFKTEVYLSDFKKHRLKAASVHRKGQQQKLYY